MYYYAPSREEHFAIEARLNAQLGAAEYDRLFLGFTVVALYDDVLIIRVDAENSAAGIEGQTTPIVAAICAGVLGRPIRHVSVLSRITNRSESN